MKHNVSVTYIYDDDTSRFTPRVFSWTETTGVSLYWSHSHKRLVHEVHNLLYTLHLTSHIISLLSLRENYDGEAMSEW